MAELKDHILLAGAETNAESEFGGILTNLNITSAGGTFLFGSYAWELDYNFVVNGDGTDNVVTQGLWSDIRQYYNHAWVVYIKLKSGDGTPQVNSLLLKAANVDVNIDTSRRIFINGVTGITTNALTEGDWYRLEILSDNVGAGKVYVRLYDDPLGTPSLISEFDVSIFVGGTVVDASIGESRKNQIPGGTDPSFVAYFDNICFWYSEAGTDTTPRWWNDTQIDYRTVDANGNYTDFTNDYIAVDEHPAAPINDSDYNQGGEMLATERETHDPVNKTVSNTLKGFMWAIRGGANLFANSDKADSKILIRDNSVDYEWAMKDGIITNYFQGYEKRPDGSTLTNATLNAMEAGMQCTMNLITTSPGALNVGVSQSHEKMAPDSDGIDDGSWTTSTGGANAWDHVVPINDTTEWIETSTNGHKQSFGHPTPVSTDRKIGSVRINIEAVGVGGNDSTIRCFFIHDPSGTPEYFYTNTFTIVADIVQYFLPNEWQTNPKTGNPWTPAEISAGEFGVELVALNSASSLKVRGFQVLVVNLSQARQTAMWMLTASGEPYESLPSGAIFKPKVMMY